MAGANWFKLHTHHTLHLAPTIPRRQAPRTRCAKYFHTFPGHWHNWKYFFLITTLSRSLGVCVCVFVVSILVSTQIYSIRQLSVLDAREKLGKNVWIINVELKSTANESILAPPPQEKVNEEVDNKSTIIKTATTIDKAQLLVRIFLEANKFKSKWI